ncbi:MAG TPA: tRNA (guanosine(37)-N1)-methyltransferase TrmD [Candidatus Eremiobacteraceae bacterium]|nr:tRNA (guanosine(37)-N1)-methyltransferase TrmD [Candidatus Eremiobacteraceae bacterium]
MQIDVLTLFPDFFRPIVEGSILGRAQSKGIARIAVHDLWDFVPEGERADDAPYGGGPGMVMRLAPIVDGLASLLGAELHVPPRHAVIVPSPAGARFDAAAARRFGALERLIIVCGHYEGIDHRLFDLVPAEEVSLGDFVLTGGEIPALAIVDATVRLLPGVLAPGSAEEESFEAGGLDWQHYTRPSVFRGVAVPEILLSGDHERVAAWRQEQARLRTLGRRPDLSGGNDKTRPS